MKTTTPNYKDIFNITYNKLNLPVRIDFDDGRYILNHYTLDGIKRRSEYFQANATEPEKVTDYAGSVQYENGLLTRITTEEGHVAPDEQDPDKWRYYYNLTDHLGNVRVTVTDPTPTEYLATLETTESTEEQAEFGDSYRPETIKTNMADTSPDNKAQLLRGYAATGDEVMGLTKSLAVYPGDKVDMQVYANFTGVNTNNPADAVNFGLMFLQAFGIPTSGEGGMNPADFDNFSNANAPTTTAYPINAYLNYVYLDKNFDLVEVGFFGVPGSTLKNPTLIQHTLDITEEGYVMIYLTNEETELTEVYFDDFKITHTPTIIAQTDSYYPFGLSHGNMSMVREGRAKNQFLYNGKELVEGFDLGWYDYGARYYAADLGRWHAVDPLAEKFWDFSSYLYTVNNPILHYDVDGNDVVNSLDNKAHREALKTFVKTEEGRKFIAKFASKGQIIEGVKFSQDGIYANHTLVLNSKNLFSAGETKHYVKKSNGDKISISNISTKSIIKLNGDLNFQFEINISNDRNEEEATETIGHEAFIHVDDDVQELEGYKEDYENGKFGDDGAESFRFKGKIGKVEVDGIEEHNNAINGQNSNMDIFINQIVELTGNDSYRRIYDEWKKTYKE